MWSSAVQQVPQVVRKQRKAGCPQAQTTMGGNVSSLLPIAIGRVMTTCVAAASQQDTGVCVCVDAFPVTLLGRNDHAQHISPTQVLRRGLAKNYHCVHGNCGTLTPKCRTWSFCNVSNCILQDFKKRTLKFRKIPQSYDYAGHYSN